MDEPSAGAAAEAQGNHRDRLRLVLLPLSGAALSCVLAWRSPLASTDPLRTTLAVLPFASSLILLALQTLPRRSDLARPTICGLLLAGAGWLFLAAIRPLVLPAGAERVLVVALYLGLLVVLWLSLARLRRGLGQRLPLRPPLAFFLLPLAAYLYFLPWSTGQRPPDGDEPWYLLTAHSLVYDLDHDLANNYLAGDSLRFLDRRLEPQTGDPQGAHGEVYSRHPILLPLLIAPAYRLAGKPGALTTMALLTALAAWMTLRVASHYLPTRPGAALLGWGLLAFAPPLLLYSYQLWVEVPAAVALLLVLDRIKLLHRRPATRWDWLMMAAAALALLLFKLRFGLLLAPLAVIALLDLDRYRRRLLVVAGGLAAGGAALLLYNWRAFGNPLRIHSWSELLLYRSSLVDYVNGLSGTFFDVAFGLFAAAPAWALLIPAAWVLARRRDNASSEASDLRRDLLLLCTPYLIAVASRAEWYGGWSPPFRYPLVLLPLLTLAIMPALERRRAAGPRLVIAALATATVALALLWIAVPGWTYNFAHGRSYPIDHLAAQLGADVSRFFPSSARPRLATILWPLLSIAGVLGVWSWRPHGLRGRRLEPALVGAIVVILGFAAIPFAASSSTTHWIEAESTHVEKTGGHPDPHPWIVHRTRFPEAWVLREGDRLSAPVVPGGERVSLQVELRYIRNHPSDLQLQLAAGNRELGTLRFSASDHDQNRVEMLGPFDWRAGDRLVITIPKPGPQTPSGVLNGVVLDRVRLVWQ